jgi:hypothetical protein
MLVHLKDVAVEVERLSPENERSRPKPGTFVAIIFVNNAPWHETVLTMPGGFDARFNVAIGAVRLFASESAAAEDIARTITAVSEFIFG